MAEYDRKQKNQLGRIIANGKSRNGQLKEFMDNRCTSFVSLTYQHSAPITQRKKKITAIKQCDRSYKVVDDLYKDLRPKAYKSSDEKTHFVHGCSKEKFHSAFKSRKAALEEMYEHAKGSKTAEVDAELAKLDVHDPTNQTKIAQL